MSINKIFIVGHLKNKKTILSVERNVWKSNCEVKPLVPDTQDREHEINYIIFCGLRPELFRIIFIRIIWARINLGTNGLNKNYYDFT